MSLNKLKYFDYIRQKLVNSIRNTFLFDVIRKGIRSWITLIKTKNSLNMYNNRCETGFIIHNSTLHNTNKSIQIYVLCHTQLNISVYIQMYIWGMKKWAATRFTEHLPKKLSLWGLKSLRNLTAYPSASRCGA